MSLRDRLLKTKAKMQEQLERGREVSRQKIDEKTRKRKHKLENMKPGSLKAIHEGLMLRKSPLDVMKEEYSRRKYEREKKNKTNHQSEDDTG